MAYAICMAKERYIPSTPESLAEFLNEKKGKMSLKDVALYLGVTPAAISHWRKGTYAPHPNVIAKLGLTPMLRVDNDEPIPQSQAILLADANERLRAELKDAKKAAKKKG